MTRGSIRTPAIPALLLALGLVGSTALAAQRDLFVASRDTHNVKRFDGETGEFLGNFVRRESQGLRETQECVFGPDGHMYVTGFRNQRVFKFHGATGESLGTFTTGFVLGNPTKISYGPDGHLYVSQWGGNGKVVKFDELTGAFLGEATNIAVVSGMDHEWDSDGNMLVLSWGNGQNGNVQKFDSNGDFVEIFIPTGHLLGPVNLWFDPSGESGDLFVLDWTKGTVERFDSEGNWIMTFVSGLENAEGFTYGPDGMLYICDWTLNTVNRYHAGDGSFDQVFASGHNLGSPNSCTFGPEQPVSSPDGPRPVPRRVSLAQNHPNPFRAATSISYSLGAPAEVTLRVYDATGRRVATLVEGRVTEGAHSVSWAPGRLPGGVYFYRLETDGLVRGRKMTVLR